MLVLRRVGPGDQRRFLHQAQPAVVLLGEPGEARSLVRFRARAAASSSARRPDPAALRCWSRFSRS